jgi:ribosomal protein L35|tara:strand:- start:6151 stop:6387 length:237 start_codon:yes stop_codon:yes gene_type:complete
VPKNKPNKGLLKRIRITKSGKIKMGRASGRHRRSHKSGDLLRSYRESNYAHASDLKRIAAMLHARVVSGSSKKASSEG